MIKHVRHRSQMLTNFGPKTDI